MHLLLSFAHTCPWAFLHLWCPNYRIGAWIGRENSEPARAANSSSSKLGSDDILTLSSQLRQALHGCCSFTAKQCVRCSSSSLATSKEHIQIKVSSKIFPQWSAMNFCLTSKSQLTSVFLIIFYSPHVCFLKTHMTLTFRQSPGLGLSINQQPSVRVFYLFRNSNVPFYLLYS